jgi:uncharacterized protein
LNPGTAIITNATSVLGAVFADRLASRGFDLVLTDKSDVRLASLTDTLIVKHNANVEAMVADLTRSTDVRSIESILGGQDQVTLLVNNAGTLNLHQFGVASAEEQHTNNEDVSAVVRLAYAAANSFSSGGAGTVINVPTVTADVKDILNGIYGGNKAFILAFTRSLQREFANSGVKFQALLASRTLDGRWHRTGIPAAAPTEAPMDSPEQLVDAAMKGLDTEWFTATPTLPDSVR